MEAPDSARHASVLLGFRAENVRSFRDGVDLSLLATALAEPGATRWVAWREGGQPIGVLPAVGVFGANASGKTNLLRALDDMRSHVLHSFRSGSPVGGVPRHAFLLDPGAAAAPSRFEIDLVIDGVRHEYGFIVDDERFVEEWAYRYPRGRAALLFHRRGDAVDLGAADRSKGRTIAGILRPNALFLSTAASANHAALLPLYAWFSRNLVLAEASTRGLRQAFTTQMLDDDRHRERILALLRAADLGIVGAVKHELDPALKDRLQRAARILMGLEDDADAGTNLPSFDEFGVRLLHGGPLGDVEFDPSDESLGTLVWFGLVGPVIGALAAGSVLLADELDASLHPSLVRQLVRLFQDPDTNPRRAQLLFNSHDAALLGDATERPMGRDQVWFTEKLADGSTRLYPLADLAPRKEEAVGRRYLAGRYGATPILSEQEFDAVADLISSGADGGR